MSFERIKALEQGAQTLEVDEFLRALEALRDRVGSAISSEDEREQFAQTCAFTDVVINELIPRFVMRTGKMLPT